MKKILFIQIRFGDLSFSLDGLLGIQATRTVILKRMVEFSTVILNLIQDLLIHHLHFVIEGPESTSG